MITSRNLAFQKPLLGNAKASIRLDSGYIVYAEQIGDEFLVLIHDQNDVPIAKYPKTQGISELDFILTAWQENEKV